MTALIRHVERDPAPWARDVVHRYCGYEHEGTGRARRLEVAQDQVTVILGFGPALVVGGPSRTPADETSFVAALHPSYAVTEERGSLRGIQVDLSPLGAHMLFGVAMHELSAELVVGLEDVLGRDGRELVERLEGEGSWRARFELLDAFVARRLERARPPAPDAVRAWSRLRDTRRHAPDRGARTRARLQHATPERPLPRADRAAAEDRRAADALPARRRAARPRRWPALRRDRPGVRLLRPAAHGPRVPGAGRDEPGEFVARLIPAASASPRMADLMVAGP